MNVQNGLGIKKFDSEGRFIITEFDEFTLFNIYFPNGKASDERLKYKMEFYEIFLKHCNKLLKEGKKIVVCGDVNTAHKEIDIARPKENSVISGFLPQEREWIDKFLAAGFIDTFRLFNQEPEQYTWWDMVTRARERNVGWRIDYFYIKGRGSLRSLRVGAARCNEQGNDRSLGSGEGHDRFGARAQGVRLGEP